MVTPTCVVFELIVVHKVKGRPMECRGWGKVWAGQRVQCGNRVRCEPARRYSGIIG